MWVITQNSAGVQRWVPAGGPRPLTATQQPITTIKKPLNMAKATKSITTKTTQECAGIVIQRISIQ
jgi:hypothetical protein